MHEGSTQLSTTSKVKFRRPGRPMKPGKYVFDPASQTFGYYLGLCNHCHAKVIKPKSELPHFVYKLQRQNKTIKVRLLRYIEKKLTI